MQRRRRRPTGNLSTYKEVQLRPSAALEEREERKERRGMLVVLLSFWVYAECSAVIDLITGPARFLRSVGADFTFALIIKS